MPAPSDTTPISDGASPPRKKRTSRWALLARITRPVVDSVPLSAQMQTLTDEVREAFGADACIIRALDGDMALLLAASGLPAESLIDELPATYGLAREIIQSRRPLVVPNTNDTLLTLAQNVPALSGTAYQFRAYAGAPLLLDDRVVGLLGVYQTSTPRKFSKNDLEHLQIVANHAAVAVENDRLFRALQNQAAQLKQQMAEAKALEADREILLADALDRARRDPLTGLLNHRAFYQTIDDQVQKANVGQDRAVPLTVVLMDVDHFKFFNKAYGHAAGDRVLQTVGETLRRFCQTGDFAARVGGDEFGLLLRRGGASTSEITALLRQATGHLGYTPPGRLTEIPIRVSIGAAVFPREGRAQKEITNLADERLRLGKSGSVVSGASEPNSQNQQGQRLRLAFASQTGFSLLNSLLLAVDGKDRYSCAHCNTVAQLCEGLARELKLSKSDTQSLQMTALVHDVGKIGISEQILRFPAALSEEARKSMETHTTLGAMLAASVPEMAHLGPLIRAHHERWDGKGYPDGLQGNAIPLLARALSVADAFAAMTTDRPYRMGRTVPDALAELQKGAGTQWDAACVTAFLRTVPAE